MTFKESLREELKVTQPGDPKWAWDMVRSAAALFNSGGGILRCGVDTNGEEVGVKNPADFLSEKSAFLTVLREHLQPVPPFRSNPQGNHIEIEFRSGVTSPSIISEVLEESPEAKHHKDKANKKASFQLYPVGTVLMRKVNGNEVSSEPPKTPYDWQQLLDLWERNRGVSTQGPLLAEFSVLINQWDPFNKEGTKVTEWRAYCIADAAGMLGRFELQAGLRNIAQNIKPSLYSRPSDEVERNKAGGDHKSEHCEQFRQLCIRLGLALAR